MSNQIQINKECFQDQRIINSINGIIEMFESGEILNKITYIMNPRSNIPSKDWSMLNKLIMLYSKTNDARGFLQWKKVGRYVKAGSHAIYILSPCIIKGKREVENVNGEKETKEYSFITGFKSTPVFRYEDTYGKELVTEEINKIPQYNYIKLLDKLNLKIELVGKNTGFYGRYIYNPYESKGVKIELATKEEVVFYHELSHAVHDFLGLQKRRSDNQCEIVAEFCASVLLNMDNKTTGMQNLKEYLIKYSENGDIRKSVLSLISDIEKIVKFIIKEGE